ncbi:MAG: U32 family peptidase [Gammaproteobacteria bacterium]|nr:U32 family peptidase [Gammaproteobacteria bacterium]
MKLSLGPVPYFWPRDRIEAFYREVETWPVDVVYLGETVCSKRRALGPAEWMTLAGRLESAGKEVVLSTLALLEAESERAGLERICGNGRYPVEANDMAAVYRLASRGGFVAGPHLNIYNREALGLIADCGAMRWVPPVELAGDTVAALQAERPPRLTTEVLAFGRLPLSFSARCFTARAHDLPKDDCAWRCEDYPDGLALETQEGGGLFAVNGIQLQSAVPCNLIESVPRMVEMGIDVLRISPLARGTAEAVEAFDAVLRGARAPAEAQEGLASLSPGGWCNGYWHGYAGMAWERPA